jgi:hypothetical protein
MGPTGYGEGDMVAWQVNPQMFGRVDHVDTMTHKVMVEVHEMMDGRPVSTGHTVSAGYGDLVPRTSDMVDAVQSQTNEEQQTQSVSDPQFSEGAWVRWDWSGGSAVGEVQSVHTDGPVSVDGTERDPSEKGEPVYKIRHWDDGSWGNTKIAYESNLSAADEPATYTDATASEVTEGDWVSWRDEGETRHGKLASLNVSTAQVTPYDETIREAVGQSVTVDIDELSPWVGPYADSCPGDDCSCGCHVHGKVPSDLFEDAPSGIHTMDGNWYGIAPSETADDEAKYELNTCNDVKDAYNLRNNGDYDIDTDTLVSRIKRAAEAHGCDGEQTPWTDEMTDTSERLAKFIATTTHE